MNDIQEINVDDIMAQIRETVLHQQGTLADRATRPSSNSPVTADLTSLEGSHDIYHIHLTSHRKILGPFVLLAKKVVRQLLTPSLERQSAYNAVNNRVALHLCQQTEALQKTGNELAQQVSAMRHELAEQMEGRHQQLAQQVSAIQQELAEQIEGRHRQLAEQVSAIQQ